MAITIESLVPLFGNIKKKMKAYIEEIVKREISNLNLPSIIEGQNRKIENQVVENRSLQKTIKEHRELLHKLQRKDNFTVLRNKKRKSARF